MSTQPIKATSKENTESPFYLIQTNGENQRYIVSLFDKIRIRTLLDGFINQSKTNIQIKVIDLDNPDIPIEYFGSIEPSILHKLMTNHENVLFHHGFHDFMIRDSESGDYMVLDEHGLVFIYSDKDYSEILRNLEANFKPDQKLIYQLNHWHVSLPDGENLFKAMITDMGLNKS